MTLQLTEREKKILEKATPHLSVGDNENHTLDALDFALRLLETENGDRDIVVPAIILHDVGWSRVPEDMMIKARIPGRDVSLVKTHEDAGVKIARDILKEIGTDDSQIEEILEIIKGHDTREDAISLNDEIVKDADKLSRYSVCFNRNLEWSGMEPQELYDDLESRIDKWFFLSASEEIARDELQKRKQEI